LANSNEHEYVQLTLHSTPPNEMQLNDARMSREKKTPMLPARRMIFFKFASNQLRGRNFNLI